MSAGSQDSHWKPAPLGPEKPSEADTLDGEDVLPGFTLPLRDLFAELDETGES